MEDVSDPPFRSVCKELGADLMYTEFVSSEGLIRQAAKSSRKLDIFEDERPVGIQIFGSEIPVMREAAAIASAVCPDLIDINYGCPVKNVACRGAGASLLQDIDKMVQMTEAVISASSQPVTVKTRLGWDENTKNIGEVALRLQDTGIKALTIHGRTRAQLYKGPADWTLIAEVKADPRITIPIFGNGDVDTPQKAIAMKELSNVDGVMVGRASIGNPWIFSEIKHYMRTGEPAPPPSLQERVRVCLSHLEKSIRWKGPKTGVFEMRRHYAGYFKGLENARAYRTALVEGSEFQEVLDILMEIASGEQVFI